MRLQKLRHDSRTTRFSDVLTRLMTIKRLSLGGILEYLLSFLVS
ncbi:hypothetical protein OESDEN_18622 [Oesophagostomum dentatum]|uniref:Uncharacterized protein n=1 Tax=Oesophagostomum dentatum TaxID=61180 RepID=A0A0B1SET5_OESDE|nr:hypothetical protein OESDEN_18622 [Oesophagostomum dentatum]